MESVFDPENVYNTTYFEPISSSVVCVICEMIVFKPKQCSSCQNVFCETCINKWMLKDSKCPYKCQASAIVEPGRIVKNIIEKIEFKCANCKTGIPYESYMAHIKICKKEEYVNCPLCLSKNITTKKKVTQFEDNILQKVNGNLISENKKLKEQLKCLESVMKILQEQVIGSKEEGKSLLIHEPFVSSEKIISFEKSSNYIFKGKKAGTDNIDDLSKEDCMGGICTDLNGWIVFELADFCLINSVTTNGFIGDLKLWHPTNGVLAKIYTSLDKKNWVEVGKFKSPFGTKIWTFNLTQTRAKYIKFRSHTYIGFGYLKINQETKLVNNPNSSNKIATEHSQILCYYDAKFYIKNGSLIGCENIGCLENKDLTKSEGFCLDSPGKITFELFDNILISNIEIGGYGGNNSLWNAEYGAGAKIEISENDSKYEHFGIIPTGFGTGIKKIVGATEMKAKYIRITHNTYLGLGYFSINTSFIYSKTLNCIYDKVKIHQKYTSNNKVAGTNNVEDLLDFDSKTGICSDAPGEIIVYFKNSITFNKLNVSGWSGDKQIWASTNGSNSQVSISEDMQNWDKLVVLPSLSESIVCLDVPLKTAKAAKITNNSYLGLGQFFLFQSDDERVFAVDSTLSKPYFKDSKLGSMDALRNPKSEKGLCVGKSENIVLDIGRSARITKIEMKGYCGNPDKLHPTQGAGCEVQSSNDGINYVTIGNVPKNFGKTLIIFSVTPTTSRYIKILSGNGYLGIGYFAAIE